MKPHTPESTSPTPTGRGAESGSAFIVTLLVLVALTLIGLTVTFVTQTEVQIGEAEKTLNRTLYSAESGVAAAAARLIVNNRTEPFTLRTTETKAFTELTDVVDVEQVAPVLETTCNLCPINQGSEFSRVDYRVSSRAVRSGKGVAQTGDATPIATRGVSMLLSLQPFSKDRVLEAAAAANRSSLETGSDDSSTTETSP